MRVAVIIPAHNAARYLAETLDSVRGQTHAHWEAVVVDDGSADATGGIVASYAARDPRIRCVGQTQQGVAAARNTGLRELGADVDAVAFLDADDLWKPYALADLVAAAASAPDAVGAHGLAYFMDANGAPLPDGRTEVPHPTRLCLDRDRAIRATSERPTTFDSVIARNPICIGTLLVRRWAVERAGAFRADMAHCEDWEYWVRLVKLGDFAFVDRPLLGYRRHGTNASSQDRSMLQGTRAVYRIAYHAPDSTPEQRRLTRLAHRCNERTMARGKRELLRECVSRRDWHGAVRQLGYLCKHLLRSVSTP